MGALKEEIKEDKMSAIGGAGVGHRNMLRIQVGLCIYKSSSKDFALDQMRLCTVFISEVPIMTDIGKQLQWLLARYLRLYLL